MNNTSSDAISQPDLSLSVVTPSCSGKGELITKYVTETVNTLKHTETFYSILPLEGIHIGRKAERNKQMVL